VTLDQIPQNTTLVAGKDIINQNATEAESRLFAAESSLTSLDGRVDDLELGGGVGGTWMNVQSTGALPDGTEDVGSLIQSAIDEVNSAGGGVVYFPAGESYYRITTPIYGRDNVILMGDGYGSHIRNDRTTSTIATDVSVFKYGNYNASDLQHSFMAETFYTCSAANAGAPSVTLSTPAEAANFVAGDFILIRDNDLVVSGSHSHPRYHEINKVASVNTGTGVIFLRNPLVNDYATLRVARSRGDLDDLFGKDVKVIGNAGVAHMRLSQQELGSAGEVLGWGIFAYGGAYECVFRGLWAEGSAFFSQNGLSRSLVENCHARLTRGKLFDVAMFSHQSTMRRIRYERTPNSIDYTGWNDQLILVGEAVHGLTYEDIEANMGAWVGSDSAAFFGNGARNNTFRRVKVIAKSHDDVIFDIRNGSWPALNNTMEECTAVVGASTLHGFLDSSPGEGNRILNPRVEGTTTGAEVMLDATSTNQELRGARLPTGRIVNQGTNNVVEENNTKYRQRRVAETVFESVSATSVTVQRSYVIPIGAASPRGRWRFRAWGNASGTASSKTISIAVNGTNRVSLSLLAADAGAWSVELEMEMRGVNAQQYFTTTEKTGTGTRVTAFTTSAIDNAAGAITVELNINVANAADAVNLRGWRVEPSGDQFAAA
jgi:Pectate lyase superfamily protein